MKQFVIIKDDLVVNHIIADTKAIAEQVTGLEAIEVIEETSFLGMGWTRSGSDWIAPPILLVEENTEEL
jgi:hypothetical protein